MQTAVITGASMGLGVEFARQLAARGENLALVARSEEPMRALAAELEQRHGIAVRVLACDLARARAAAEVAAWLEAEGLEPKWLVNNAGFGSLGKFAEVDAVRVRDMVMVNVVALTELSRLLLPRMARLADARLINVASTAGFQPLPRLAEYAATKAFVISLSEALHEEALGTPVRVLCLCPGPTATNFGANAGMPAECFQRQVKQSAEDVVRRGLRASDKGRALCVTQQRLVLSAQRLVPRAAVRKIAGWLVKAFE